MSYIDILIPFVAGLFFILSPESMINPVDTSFEKKKSRFRTGGFILIGVAVLYSIIKVFGS